MDELKPHWTGASTDDFLYKVATDYVLQIENCLDSVGGNQTTLAEKLNVTPARVSQVLNNPGNMTLRLVVEYARKLGKKVAVVLYDDNDPENAKGPINSQVFERCWQRAGRPSDFFDIEDADAFHTYVITPEMGVPFIRAEPKGNVTAATYSVTGSAGTDAERIRIEEKAGATNNG